MWDIRLGEHRIRGRIGFRGIRQPKMEEDEGKDTFWRGYDIHEKEERKD